MIDRLGHLLAAWLPSVNASTAVLLAAALLVERALVRRTRASLRIALYAPVALRAIVPMSWSIPVTHVPNVAAVLPVDSLSAKSASSGALPYAAIAIAYVAVAAWLATRAAVRRRMLARALESAHAARVEASPVPVLRHPALGPMVVGLLRPRIVIPESMLDGADAAALDCVLRHEIAHLRRRDAWLSAAMSVLLLVLWPVIPLWIAAARVRHLIELACDERALSGADASERRRYGHVLLDVAEQQSFAFAGALHFGATLRARIEAIALHRPWPRGVQASVVAAAVAGFAACSSTGPAATTRADDYGYKFEDDSAKQAAAESPTQAPSRNAEGRLAPEAIQSVVRASFGEFRVCYERALATSPELQGTIRVSFVIAPDGSVERATDHGSTLPDADVVRCVVDGFSRLAFPSPQGGFVTVVYPIVFSPGD